ncbi:MAG: VanW family protein [Desulfitobacteriaceae bacterium]
MDDGQKEPSASGTTAEEVVLHDEWEEEALPVINLKDIVPAGIDWIKHTKVILTLVSLMILLIMAGIVSGIYVWDHGLIADGISVNGVDIGHLTPQDARKKLEPSIRTLQNRPVEFDAGQEKLKINLQELGLSLNLESALDQAYSWGRQGSLSHKILDKLKASQGLKLNAPYIWDEQKLTETLHSKLEPLNQAPLNATFKIENNSMNISKEVDGKSVDFLALVQEVRKLEPVNIHPIKIPIQTIKPAITSAQLEVLKPDGLVATYSTRFDPSQVNRTDNLRLAAKALDGVLLKPEENFSFNDRVGPRTEEAGYLEAIIIENGQFVPGLGGGVCQVSSTLYNTVLLADLTITERANHALAVTYVPLGQDATVAYGSLDLKFRNDSGGYLLIRSQVDRDTITFSLYGKSVPGRQVTISNSINKVIQPPEQRRVDRSLPPGSTSVLQSGQAGYIVSTTRLVKVRGKIIKTESLGSSTYQAVPRIILTGP